MQAIETEGAKEHHRVFVSYIWHSDLTVTKYLAGIDDLVRQRAPVKSLE